MKKQSTSLRVQILLIAILIFAGCGGGGQESSSEGTTGSQETDSGGTVLLKFSASNSLNSVSSNKIQSNYTNVLSTNSITNTTPDIPEFRPVSITSGPPDGFRLGITKIQIGNQIIFENSDGVFIEISGSQVDITELLSQLGDRTGDSDTAAIKIPEGNYDQISLTYLAGAEIKGCVSGNFADHSLVPGEHTYCTQTAFSNFADEMGQNEDFEDQSPEWMLFNLKWNNSSNSASEQFSLTYEIPGGFTVEDGTEVKLNLVIDLNRMLRYYNRGRSDQGAHPSYGTEYAYFFDSVFSHSVYVFIGDPGSIYGFDIETYACTNATNIPENHICESGGMTVALWMTLIEDSNGNPIFASFMPDDDMTLTVIKGNQHDVIGDYFKTIDNGSLNIRYALDNGASQGIVLEFPEDPSELTMNSTFTGPFFEGFQESYGLLYVNRKL